MGPKASYSGPFYTRLQESLYVWYGNLGGVIYVLAVICTVALAVLAVRDRAWRSLPVAAAAVEVVALGRVPWILVGLVRVDRYGA